MSEELSQDGERSQSIEVREMQSCENWEDDGTIPIIVNHIVDENSNVSNFDERTIGEENDQFQAYQSSENLVANSLTFANWRPTARNHRSRTRIRNCRRNHGQDKLLKSFTSLNKSINKSLKSTVKTLKKMMARSQSLQITF